MLHHMIFMLLLKYNIVKETHMLKVLIWPKLCESLPKKIIPITLTKK